VKRLQDRGRRRNWKLQRTTSLQLLWRCSSLVCVWGREWCDGSQKKCGWWWCS